VSVTEPRQAGASHILLLAALLLAGLALAVTSIAFSLDLPARLSDDWGREPPQANGDRPWRIGYYEGGPYRDYPQYLRALIAGLAELGWIRPVDLGKAETPSDDSVGLWAQLAEQADGSQIEFVASACWSGDWDPAVQEANRRQAMEALRGGELDLIIAMGTRAGQDLRNGHSVPTVVISATDPIESGIIDSAEDSGRDHLTTLCDPDRYVRQVRAFYNIARFDVVGVIADVGPQAQVYAHLPQLRRVAEEAGFRLRVGRARDEELSHDPRVLAGEVTAEELAAVEVDKALSRMADEIDAFWIPDHRGFDPENMPAILKRLIAQGVVTWSPTGPDHVRRGVVLGMPERDLDQIGLRHARQIAAIFHGAIPRELPMRFEPSRAIILNVAAADRCGFSIPPGLLQAADEVYHTIDRTPEASD
jgi:ABC-type uncharacterized transport system substrate-binding protein